MGETLAQTLAGKKTAYHPGPWFNSAKFFDIEYQTYGKVSPTPDPKKEIQLYWQHPKKNKTLRFSFDPEKRNFSGVICLGIRLRHEYFNQWLSKETSLDEVIKNLEQSFFDPEFSTHYAMEIQSLWELKKSTLSLNF